MTLKARAVHRTKKSPSESSPSGGALVGSKRSQAFFGGIVTISIGVAW